MSHCNPVESAVRLSNRAKLLLSCREFRDIAEVVELEMVAMAWRDGNRYVIGHLVAPEGLRCVSIANKGPFAPEFRLEKSDRLKAAGILEEAARQLRLEYFQETLLFCEEDLGPW